MAVLNSCSRIPSLQLTQCMKSARPQFQLFRRSVSDRHKRFPHAEMLSPVGVLPSSSVHPFRTRIAKIFTNKSKRLRAK
jgi:hypothetical protein